MELKTKLIFVALCATVAAIIMAQVILILTGYYYLIK